MASTTSTVSRHRVFVLGALAGVVALAWGYLLYLILGRPMTGMDAGMTAMMALPSWNAGYYLATLTMWMVMMAGMMLPSAAPTILLFDALHPRAGPAGRGSHASTALFAAGYLVAWTVFSVAATTAQWGLSASGLLSATMAGSSPTFAGLLLLAAGAYQLSPWKSACLGQCRSPAEFLVRHRREGSLGALVTGLQHGAYCIGCCWALMVLLFAFGVMNLLWVAVLAVFVLIEKLTPAGALIGRVGAVVMISAGAALMVVG